MSNNLLGSIGAIMGTIAAHVGNDTYQRDVSSLEKEFKISHVDPKKIQRCHICEESGTTLYKLGKNKKGKKIYICKDCKMLKDIDELNNIMENLSTNLEDDKNEN